MFWWLNIHLPTQRTWVQSLLQEYSTCHMAPEPVHHPKYRSPCTLEPVFFNKRSRHNKQPVNSNKRVALFTTIRESPPTQQQRPRTAKNKDCQPPSFFFVLFCFVFWFFFSGSYMLLRKRQWQPTPVLLPGKSNGRRSLVGCSPWDC